MKTVGKLVGGLSNLQSVMPMLTNLGRTHKMLGIQPAWFDAMRESLCEALAEKLGPTKWTHEVRAPPPPCKPRIRLHTEVVPCGVMRYTYSPSSPPGTLCAPPADELGVVGRLLHHQHGHRQQLPSLVRARCLRAIVLTGT